MEGGPDTLPRYLHLFRWNGTASIDPHLEESQTIPNGIYRPVLSYALPKFINMDEMIVAPKGIKSDGLFYMFTRLDLPSH